jgi:hypothetical protein
VGSLAPNPRVPTSQLLRADELCRLTLTETKCSGTRPQCINCEKQGEECIYEQPRRDRLRE